MILAILLSLGTSLIRLLAMPNSPALLARIAVLKALPAFIILVAGIILPAIIPAPLRNLSDQKLAVVKSSSKLLFCSASL